MRSAQSSRKGLSRRGIKPVASPDAAWSPTTLLLTGGI